MKSATKAKKLYDKIYNSNVHWSYLLLLSIAIYQTKRKIIAKIRIEFPHKKIKKLAKPTHSEMSFNDCATKNSISVSYWIRHDFFKDIFRCFLAVKYGWLF